MTNAKTPTDPEAGQGSSATLDALIAGCDESCPRCHAKITSEQLKAIFTQAPDDRVPAVRDAFNQYMENVETTMRVFRTPECVDRNKLSSQAQPWVQNDGVRSTQHLRLIVRGQREALFRCRSAA